MSEKPMMEKPDLWQLAAELKKTMQCNCDLDNWEPELSTGHSWVCRIHRKLMGLPERIR